MIPKPNKPQNLVTSNRAISLLSVISKVFERLFLKELLPVLEKQHMVPDHQFGFRHNHGTSEQCHRILETILWKENSTAPLYFWTFSKLSIKYVKKVCYLNWKFCCLLLSTFCFNHILLIDCFTLMQMMKSQTLPKLMPQGSVLGPVLYTIFTSDMPTTSNILVATYADDTATIAPNDCQI